MSDLGQMFQPIPSHGDTRGIHRWNQFKKLAIAAERHRIECLFRESGAGQAFNPATGCAAASDSQKQKVFTEGCD
jgi:hypothetical protein